MDTIKIAARVAEVSEDVFIADDDAPEEHTGIIRKTPGKSEWCVKSEKNPDWSGGCYDSKAKAEKRLQEVEFFKHKSSLGSTLDYLMKSCQYITRQDTELTQENLNILFNALRQATVAITYKSAPEYKSIEDFVQYMIDDERTEFTNEDLAALNYRTRTPVAQIRKALEAYGLKLSIRDPEKRTRGYTTSDHDRWFGPGSEATHGGSGFDNLE